MNELEEPTMSDLSMQLPERLSRLGETGLLIPLLRLLADGDPVTVQQLSVAAGRTIDEVRLGGLDPQRWARRTQHWLEEAR